jgi:hypothetical protein
MSNFDKILIAIFVIIATVGIIFFYLAADNHSNKCMEKGGTVIDTPNGRICIKAERIGL